MENAELLLKNFQSPSAPAVRRLSLRAWALPLAVLALLAGMSFRSFVDSREATTSSKLTASYIEVQTTFLLYAVENGESIPDYCSRLEATVTRARELMFQTRSNSTLFPKATLLLTRLGELKNSCGTVNREMAAQLQRTRDLARELTLSLNSINPAELSPEARQTVAYPMPAPNAASLRPTRL